MIIHNIFTGGTIGSHINNAGSISTDESCPYKLLEMFRQLYGSSTSTDVTFVNSEPYCILSENLSAKYILKLIAAVGDALKNNPDGIIVTHGTDTLQYSAAMLSLVFGGSPIPIILVSSDYVLEDKRANGLINYRCAIDFIARSAIYAKPDQKASGVFVSYCNKDGLPTIHRGTRLLPAVPFSADVRSGGDFWYGRYAMSNIAHNFTNNSTDDFTDDFADNSTDNFTDNSTDNFIHNSEYKAAPDNIANLCEYAGISYDDINLMPFSESILRLISYPGMAYPKLTSAVKVIMIESYHSGTICINEELKSFAANAAKLNIPIYVTGLLSGAAEYETVDMYRKFGIEPIYNISPVTAYCKFWLAVCNNINIRDIAHAHIAEDCF